MTEDQFIAILPMIVSGLVKDVMRRCSWSEDEAIEAVYNSRLYMFLADEPSGVWHFSAPLLGDLFMEEQRHGSLTFPEC